MKRLAFFSNVRRGSRFRALPVTAVALAGLTVPVFMGTAASAASGWTPFHDVYSEVTTDTCDVSGLTVRVVYTDDGRRRVIPRGPDRLPYMMVHADSTVVVTNLATGEFATESYLENFNTLQVTDNGDGTLTTEVQVAIMTKWYDEAGNMVAHGTSQQRLELLIDDAGTPSDPSDDQFIAGHPTKSVDHGDDFCTAVVRAIG